MGEKLEFLIKQKGLTTTSFARMLDVQPSGISHIISGRNKPSFDLVVKILKLFPDLNPDWLLLDDEQIYRLDGSKSMSADLSPLGNSSLDDTLFSQAQNLPVSEAKAEAENLPVENLSFVPTSTKSVERIIILYKDKSFETYTPSSR